HCWPAELECILNGLNSRGSRAPATAQPRSAIISRKDRETQTWKDSAWPIYGSGGLRPDLPAIATEMDCRIIMRISFLARSVLARYGRPGNSGRVQRL